jgi:hypothetical protein
MADPHEQLELIPGSPLWQINFGEPRQEYGPRECDWGDCDKPAVTLRNDVLGYGWLPVCQECRMFPSRIWTAAPAAGEGRDEWASSGER